MLKCKVNLANVKVVSQSFFYCFLSVRGMSGTNSMAEPDACPMHQRGTCTSAPVIYKALPHTCTALALQPVQHQHSNKWLTIMPSYNQIALLLFVYETSIVRSWLPVGAFPTAHCVEPCIRTWGAHRLH